MLCIGGKKDPLKEGWRKIVKQGTHHGAPVFRI